MGGSFPYLPITHIKDLEERKRERKIKAKFRSKKKEAKDHTFCVGSFFSTLAQVAGQGSWAQMLIVLRDWAWFTVAKLG